MSVRPGRLGGIATGGAGAGVLVRLDLPGPAPLVAQDAEELRARRMRQVKRAMAMADGMRSTFADGTVAHTAHRRVRDGARVALITIPRLLRFDVHPRADCFSFTVRNLTGMAATGPARELPARPHHRADGPPLNEYELELSTPDGRAVWIVVRVPPYLGALESDYSAVALIR